MKVLILILLIANILMNQTLLMFLLHARQTWETQLILAIFSVRSYLPLIRADSVTYMQGFGVCVKEAICCMGLIQN